MKQFAVIGLGRFGWRVATSLMESGAEVLAIDRDPDLVQDIVSHVTDAVVLDSTDEEALRAVGVDEMDGAVVAIGEDVEACILTVSILSELGLPLIVARAVTAVEARILAKVGATKVVYPEDDTAHNVANSLVSDYVVDYFAISPELSVARMAAPPSFVGRTLRDLEIRARYNVSVVAIDRHSAPGDGEDARQAPRYVLNMPGPDAIVDGDDLLVLLGTRKAIERIQQAVAKGHA